MKVLDVKKLNSSIEGIHSEVSDVQAQISAIQRSVRDFVATDDALKGKTGDSIRSFFSTVHEPFLIFMHQSLTNYSTVLHKIQNKVMLYESNPDGLIRQDFIEHEVKTNLTRTLHQTEDVVNEINQTLRSVSDIVHLQNLDMGGFRYEVGEGKRALQNNIEQLYDLDAATVRSLNPVKNDLETMRSYVSNIESKFKSGDLSVTNFNDETVESLTDYNAIMDSIYNKNQTEIFAFDIDSIEGMSMYEIKKVKEKLLLKLDKNSQEFLNTIYADFEAGHIDRDTFQTIIKEFQKPSAEKLDTDSCTYLEKAYHDYKNDKMNNNTFTSIFSGIVSTGATFVQDALNSVVTKQTIEGAVDSTAKWIKETTELFLNPNLLAVTPDGTNVGVTLTSAFKDKLRNIYNFGAKYGPGIVGTALDFGTQVITGEEVKHAATKSAGHIGTAVLGRLAGPAIVAGTAALFGITLGTGGVIIAGIVVGILAASAFDWAYDKWGRDIVNNVADVSKEVAGNIGDAVSGFFGNLKSAFS